MIEIFTQPKSIQGVTIPFIIPYLIIVNVIGFLVYILDYHLYMSGLGFYSGTEEHATTMVEFIMTILLLIDVLGGMVGKLLDVFILQKGKIFKADAIANFNLYIIPFCVLVSWLVILFTFFIPLLSDWFKPIVDLNIGNVPFKFLVLGYFVVINTITLILFPRMKRFAYVITPREKLCMVLGLLGGATGGYLSMKVTCSHQNSSMLMNTLPEIMIRDAIVISCVFLVV